MHLGAVAGRAPDRPAIVMGATGESVTFRELDERSNRLAHLLRSRGLEHGGGIVILVENHLRFLEACWAAQRSGLYFTTVNTHLTADEAGYIVDDCDATVLVSSARLAPVATALGERAPKLHTRLMLDTDDGRELPEGWEPYEPAIADQPATPLDDEAEGDFMLYSSGTTGRPKGIRRPLPLTPMGEGLPGATPLLRALGGCDGGVYLSPAPLYHSAPMAWSMAAHRVGMTAVVMERFDPVDALALIEREHVTHSQWVPTMFVRMLKLPKGERSGFDLSSHQAAIHAAAPCPVEMKRQMIEWWGPIISEYYSATEGMGATFIASEEWLAHPGSVGKAIVGTPHILDDDGRELPTGAVGTVWFDGGQPFEYHGDADKTAAARRDDGYATVGDVGYLDDEGYLYLTDRKTFMIISGGVNIYPQETENLLVTHPKVMDVAVIGVPHAELGEEVKAVVQPLDWGDAGPDLEAELIAFCQERISRQKCPRSVDFEHALPRLDTGKLYKRTLRDRYWK